MNDEIPISKSGIGVSGVASTLSREGRGLLSLDSASNHQFSSRVSDDMASSKLPESILLSSIMLGQPSQGAGIPSQQHHGSEWTVVSAISTPSADG
jgi:hypothetical protein